MFPCLPHILCTQEVNGNEHEGDSGGTVSFKLAAIHLMSVQV